MNDFYKFMDKDKISTFTKWLAKLSPTEFATIGFISSIILSELLNPDEQNSVGNFFVLVGQVLITTSAQAHTIYPNYISPSLTDFNNLEKQLQKLKKDFFNFKKESN